MLAPVVIPVILFLDRDFKRWAAWSPLLLAVAVSIAPSPSLQGVLGVGALLCALSVRRVERFSLWIGIFVISAAVLLDFSTGRPAGLFKNALSAGEALSLFAVATNNPALAFVSGFTGSRSALLVAVLSPHGRIKFGRQLYFMVVAATVGGLATWAAIHGIERFTPGAIGAAAELRAETYDNPGGWLGSGYGAYVGQRPHNVFISLWAQMGVLSVPVWLTVAWHARRAHWRALLPLAPSAFLNDWIVSTPSGILAVGLYMFLAHEQRERA